MRISIPTQLRLRGKAFDLKEFIPPLRIPTFYSNLVPVNIGCVEPRSNCELVLSSMRIRLWNHRQYAPCALRQIWMCIPGQRTRVLRWLGPLRSSLVTVLAGCIQKQSLNRSPNLSVCPNFVHYRGWACHWMRWREKVVVRALLVSFLMHFGQQLRLLRATVGYVATPGHFYEILDVTPGLTTLDYCGVVADAIEMQPVKRNSAYPLQECVLHLSHGVPYQTQLQYLVTLRQYSQPMSRMNYAGAREMARNIFEIAQKRSEIALVPLRADCKLVFLGVLRRLSQLGAVSDQWEVDTLRKIFEFASSDAHRGVCVAIAPQLILQTRTRNLSFWERLFHD